MYNDSFKRRYTTIPFATYRGDHPSGERSVTLLHCHREVELLLMLEGEAVFHINGRDCLATAGDVIAVSPYGLHATTFLDGIPCRHVCLCFDLSLLHDRALCAALEEGTSAIASHVPHTHPAAKGLAEAILHAFDAHAAMARGWEFAVVGALSSAFGALMAHGLIGGESSPGARDGFCHRAIAFMDAHLAEPITSTDAAEALYLSHGHFCRTFRARFSYPFGEYLTRLRIERAEHLLRDTDWRISQIASAVGFDSFSYFSKCFRESTGMSPSAYRRESGEEA